MGRRRKPGNEKLPPYCVRQKGAVVYREYLGAEGGRPQFAPAITLGPESLSDLEIWQRYGAIVEDNALTLRKMIGAYLDSPQFKKLKAATRKEYERYTRIISEYKTKSGDSFGDALAASITKKTIRRWLDHYPKKTQGDRVIQFLKSVYNWAIQRLNGIDSNPCAGVDLNRPEVVHNIPTTEELEALIGLAREVSPPYSAIMMQLAYLCRLRRNEIEKLNTRDKLAGGLRCLRSKGSKGEITTYTPRLLSVLDQCARTHLDARAVRVETDLINGELVQVTPLVVDREGTRICKNQFDSAWQRLRAHAKARGIKSFTFHAIKHRGVTDHIDHDAGHIDPRMKDLYTHKLKRVEATQ